MAASSARRRRVPALSRRAAERWREPSRHARGSAGRWRCSRSRGFARLGFWQYARDAARSRRCSTRAAQVLRERTPLRAGARGRCARRAISTGSPATAAFDARRRCCSTTSSATAAPACACIACSQPDDGAPLLVDFGWLPLAGRSHACRRCAAAQARCTCAACCAPPPSSGLALGAALQQVAATALADDARGSRGDLRARCMSRTSPRVLRLDPGAADRLRRATSTSCPTPCRPNATSATRCNGSALALAVLVTALVLTFRKPKPRRMNRSRRPTPRATATAGCSSRIFVLFFGAIAARRRAAFLRLAPGRLEEPRRTAAAAGRPARADADARRRRRVRTGIRPSARGASSRWPTVATTTAAAACERLLARARQGLAADRQGRRPRRTCCGSARCPPQGPRPAHAARAARHAMRCATACRARTIPRACRSTCSIRTASWFCATLPASIPAGPAHRPVPPAQGELR